MARLSFTRDHVSMLKQGLETLAKQTTRATKALDDLGLVDLRVAAFDTLGEVLTTKLGGALGEAERCELDLHEEEVRTARLGCTLLLAELSKLAEKEVTLFVDTSATHDRANALRSLRDVLDGQGIIVEEPPKGPRPRRSRSASASGVGLVRVGYGVNAMLDVAFGGEGAITDVPDAEMAAPNVPPRLAAPDADDDIPTFESVCDTGPRPYDAPGDPALEGQQPDGDGFDAEEAAHAAAVGAQMADERKGMIIPRVKVPGDAPNGGGTSAPARRSALLPGTGKGKGKGKGKGMPRPITPAPKPTGKSARPARQRPEAE